MTRTSERERGSVTLFVVLLTPAILILAGLVVDGGALLRAKQDADAVADAAARAGAQALDESQYRDSGDLALDQDQVHQDVIDYLESTEYEGTVRVVGNLVEVTVQRDEPLVFLRLAGASAVTIEGHGTARAAHGADEDEG